jgi:hypothetical protein
LFDRRIWDAPIASDATSECWLLVVCADEDELTPLSWYGSYEYHFGGLDVE